MHTHLRQYLRTDAIVAQFVHIGLFHACLHTEHARKSVRRMAVQNDHNARSCLSNDLHGTRQELTARSFLTQQVSEGRELMHAHQSWRVEADRSEEHTSELQSLMRISYAVFCLNKKKE